MNAPTPNPNNQPVNAGNNSATATSPQGDASNQQAGSKAASTSKATIAKSANRRDYVAFLPPALEVSAQPVPFVVPVLILTLLLLLSAGFAWSFWAVFDVYASVAGRIRTSEPVKIVQPLETGRVIQNNAANGARVLAGDVLLQLDTTSVLADLNAARRNRWSQAAEVSRRKAAIAQIAKGETTPPVTNYPDETPSDVIAREEAQSQSGFGALSAAIAANETQLHEAMAKRQHSGDLTTARESLVGILGEQEVMAKTLFGQNVGSRSDLLSAREAKSRAEVDLTDVRAQMAELDATIANALENRKKLVADFLNEQTKAIQDAERKIEQLDEEIRKQQSRLDGLTLKAPVTGTVQQLGVTTAGQVVVPGQNLMVIVPETAELQVEALIPSSEIGFARPGAEVVIKVDAFPFTRYGTLAGRLTSYSEDAVTVNEAAALQDPEKVAGGSGNINAQTRPDVANLFYVAKIKLQADHMKVDGQDIRLVPGMTVRAEILTERRRAIDYVLSPVAEVLLNAGHER